jgi:amidase
VNQSSDILDLDLDALHLATLEQVAEAVAVGRLTAVQATERTLARIEAVEPRYGAFEHVLAERALADAAAVDAIGRDNGPMGPLHGVPVVIKDLIDLAGVPCAAGTRVRRSVIPEHDAHVVRRLKAAGAVIVGKVKLTEGAFSHHHPDVAAPLNPWGADRWTGVSSSGSGVSVAARMAFGALGTDTGGSIRFPSAACGLVGVKPTYGRVSRQGAFPLGESLDHIGPMTRTVADAARMLTALAGHDPDDPNSLTQDRTDFLAEMAPPPTGLRLGIDRGWIARGVDPAVTETVVEAAGALAGAGLEIVDLALPDASALVEGWAVTCGVEAAHAHGETFPARRGEYGPVLAALLDLGHRSTALQYVELERAREHYRRALDRVFEDVDALILPAMPFRVPTLAEMDATPEPGAAEAITFTAPFDYSGHPTVTVPAGLDEDGLPLAIQIVGPHLGEGLILRIAAAFERTMGPLPAPPGAQ